MIKGAFHVLKKEKIMNFLEISGIVFWIFAIGVALLIVSAHYKRKYKSKFQRNKVGKFLYERELLIKFKLGFLSKEEFHNKVYQSYPTFIRYEFALKHLLPQEVKAKEDKHRRLMKLKEEIERE